jgi:hypothetical protein
MTKVETVEFIKPGDTVIWRNGKHKSKTFLPLGIAGCAVVDVGESHDGTRCARIKLPEGFPAPLDSLSDPEGFWVREADLER